MVLLRMGSLLTLGVKAEIDRNRYFEKGKELAKFPDKTLDKHDDHPSIYYTGNSYRYFINVREVNRSEDGRGANEFKDILEYEGKNCFIVGGNACFLKCINCNFKNDFSIEYFQ